MAETKQKSADPRHLGFKILVRVLEKNQSLDEAFEAALKDQILDQRDIAFTRHLSTTTIRYLAFIDKTLSSFLKRPLPQKALWVRHWLRLGTTQILFLDVPDHAAVNTTVEAIGRTKTPAAKTFKGLANGILRNVIRNKEAILKNLENNPESILPRWIRQRWQADFGESQVRKIILALQVQPPLDLTLKQDVNKKALMDALEAKEIFPDCLRLNPKGKISALPAFKDGCWWAQDVAAMLPPLLLGNVTGKKVLDLCAAPGGKTLYLASRGAKVTAVDISKTRLKRLEENLARTALTAEVICSDVLKFKPGQKFDFVLLDAPCSATGTLRRHPDVPYHRGGKDIQRLADLQAKILKQAVTFLNLGGILVYCVCSLEKEEGPEVVEDFLQESPNIQRLPVHAEELAGHQEWITEKGDLRTLPSHLAADGGMDGFYAARLKV